MTELNGQSLGPYKIIGEIGRGGMANVYRAVQPSIGREVALKVLPAQFLQDATFLERFTREVQVIAALQHPRILPVHDFGEHDGRPYIVMALMPGGTLLSRIRRYPLGMPVQEAKHIIAQIAEGLDFAHRRGVIHRDFKPTNLLFDEEDNVYLSDFGIAKIAETTAAATQGQFFGTPGYMAPELAEPGDATPAVDMYALGVTLFEMLTSSPPYNADTPMRLMYMHVNQPVPDIRAFRSELPEGMEYLIQRAMAKDPADRYATAAELARELADVASETWGGPAANWQAWRDKQMAETREFAAAAGSAHDQATLDHLDPDEASPDTIAIPTESRSRIPLLAGVGGLLLLALIALVVFVVLPGGRSKTPAAADATTPPTLSTDASPADLPAGAEPEDLPVTLASIGSTVEPLSGLVELRLGREGLFEQLDVLWLVYPGDAVRTGPEGRALFFITEGVYAEVGPDSEVALERSEPTDAGWAAALFHSAGLGSYAVARDESLELAVLTPVGVIYADDAAFWIEEHSGGWCFVPTEGEILLEVGEDDSNEDDDILLSAASEDSVIVDFDAVHVGGKCVIEALVEASQTPSTTSSQGGASPTAAPIEDPCTDHGGLQWQGDSCACSGVITAVIICNDGTKWDSPTGQTCTPNCGSAGGGAGGSSGGGNLCGNGQVDAGEECDPPGSQGLWCGNGTSYYFCTQTCVWSSMCKNF